MNNTSLKPKKLELPPQGDIQQVSSMGMPPTMPEFTKKAPPKFTLKKQKADALKQVEDSQRQQVAVMINNLQQERASNVIVYHSRNIINGDEVANFYQLFSGISKVKNLDLILHSNGGIADDAFKMCRLCRQHTEGKFSVLVPYRAKSAATLLALGADELVMGPASEIGPVDPMIFVALKDGGKHLIPAHSIKDGLDFFEGRIKAEPKTALIYSQLLEGLDPMVIGAYQRAIESSKQYAETLLTAGLLKGQSKEDITKVAKALAEKYKSHGFVIDRDIAREEYGLNVINATENTWENLWNIYNILEIWLEDNSKIGSIIRTSNSELIIDYSPIGGQK